MSKLLFEQEVYAIRGAIFEVNRELGVGFLESVYQECLEKEFKLRNIPFVAHRELRLAYKSEPLSQIFKPDLVCFDSIIVELKVAKDIADAHKAQVLNYLKATQMKVGLIINFGSYPKAQIERLAL